MKRSVLAMAIAAWLFTPECYAQCPAQENLVYYNYQDEVYSVDLVSGAEALILGSVPSTIDGVAIDMNAGGTEFVMNCLAANPDAGDLLYWGNDNSIFGIRPSDGSLFHISNLVTDFPAVFPPGTQLNLDSGGGSYYDGHYYIGSDCNGIYDLTMSADGLTVTDAVLFSDIHFQYGDIIVAAAGCSGFPTMLISSTPFIGGPAPLECSNGSQAVGLYEMDMATRDTNQLRPDYRGQLAISANGNVYNGIAGTFQEFDICDGSPIGVALPVTLGADIHDMTGPGLCMQADPIPRLIATPDFDTIPGYNTTTIDVVANDPADVDPSSILITKNGQNGTATLSGTDMTYTPTFGFTGYDTICYRICSMPATNCDTVIAVFAIGDDHDMDGLLDVNECPSWDLNIMSCDIDGDNIPNIYDADSDNDSILDEYECPMYNGVISSCDTDGDGVPDYMDIDSDDDGLLDAVECPGWTNMPSECDMDGDNLPNFRDLDSDGDGILDEFECPAFSGTVTTCDTDGDGSPDYLDIDSDGDGILDEIECPAWDGDNASCDTDGDNIPNFRDEDSDGDSIPDELECPTFNGTISTCDTDGDGDPDHLDTDSDNDGLPDELECPSWTGPGACDTDGDGIPNFRDDDSDNDTFLDGTFNEFPTIDCDDDGISDYLDPDPCDICIPEGFSPNGDGRNDVFEIVGLERFPNNRLKVFNRWGEEVFDQINYQNNWGGDNQGKQEVLNGDLLPVGTYYVIFEYESLGSTKSYDGICYIQY